MPSYPSFLLPDDSVKIRFREPFASQALNMKTDGIVPPGIYNGFTPNVDMATPNVLLLNTDPYRNDSVAVGDVYSLNGAIWTADYNLTIRTTLQVQLDFTGHTVFPCWVVLRPAYSIVAHPFSGLTNAQIVTINTLTVNDSNALALHHGDIRICQIHTGLPLTGHISVTAPTNRDENGGALVTQSQVTSAFAGIVPTFFLDNSSGLYTTTSLYPTYDPTPVNSFSFTKTLTGPIIVLLNAFTSGDPYHTTTNVGVQIDSGVITPIGAGQIAGAGVLAPVFNVGGSTRILNVLAGNHTFNVRAARMGGGFFTNTARVERSAMLPLSVIIIPI